MIINCCYWIICFTICFTKLLFCITKNITVLSYSVCAASSWFAVFDWFLENLFSYKIQGCLSHNSYVKQWNVFFALVVLTRLCGFFPPFSLFWVREIKTDWSLTETDGRLTDLRNPKNRGCSSDISSWYFYRPSTIRSMLLHGSVEASSE